MKEKGIDRKITEIINKNMTCALIYEIAKPLKGAGIGAVLGGIIGYAYGETSVGAAQGAVFGYSLNFVKNVVSYYIADNRQARAENEERTTFGSVDEKVA